MMKRKGHGVELKASLSLAIISIVSFCFVDDTDLPMSAPSRTTKGEEIIQSFQEALDRWAGALKATGGELAPLKSCFALIDFRWTGKDWKYRNTNNMPGGCTLDDKYNNKIHLQRIEVTEAVETLGVFLSIDGLQTKHKTILKEKADEFAEKISMSNCDPNTAIYTFNTCLMKSLEYSLVTSNLTKKEWDEIIKKAKEKSLQKGHFSYRFPLKPLFAPKKFGGVGFDHLYYKQGIEKIQTLIQEIVSSTQTGLLISSVMEEF